MKESAPQPPPAEILAPKLTNEIWNQEKMVRHLDNLQHLTGYFHGTYFESGIARPKPKETK